MSFLKNLITTLLQHYKFYKKKSNKQINSTQMVVFCDELRVFETERRYSAQHWHDIGIIALSYNSGKSWNDRDGIGAERCVAVGRKSWKIDFICVYLSL